MNSRRLERIWISINPGITWLTMFFFCFSVFVRSISKRCEATPENCSHFQGETPRSRHCTEVRFCTVLFMRLDLSDWELYIYSILLYLLQDPIAKQTAGWCSSQSSSRVLWQRYAWVNTHQAWATLEKSGILLYVTFHYSRFVHPAMNLCTVRVTWRVCSTTETALLLSPLKFAEFHNRSPLLTMTQQSCLHRYRKPNNGAGKINIPSG